MPQSRRRSPRPALRALAAAALFASPFALASDPAATLDQADALVKSGSLVRAKHALGDLKPAGLTAAQRDRAAELLASIDRRMRSMDAVEISLQRAELALELGDNREAERQASAARRHRAANEADKARAAELLAQVEQARRDFAPLVDATLNRAVTDFINGDFALAKAGFDAVYRSGVDLDGAQIRTIEKHRTRILEIERERGQVFEIDSLSLAALQPGRVDRTNDPRPSRGNEQPAQPDGQDAPIDLDEPAAQPEQPVPAPATVQPTDDELFQ